MECFVEDPIIQAPEAMCANALWHPLAAALPFVDESLLEGLPNDSDLGPD